MVLNILLSLGLIAGIVFLGKKYVYDGSVEDHASDGINVDGSIDTIDVKYLVKEVSETFSRTLRRRFEDDNLSREEFKKRNRKTANLRAALTKASYGDKNSKRIVKSNIKDLLYNKKYGINEYSINNIIAFNNPDKLTSIDKFQILFYLYKRAKGDDGFSAMMQEYELYKPVKGKDGIDHYRVTKEMIDIVYRDVIAGGSGIVEDYRLEFTDKIEILAQRIYEKYIGFGVVDLLYESPIDEIDVGVSGIPDGSFTVKTKVKNLPYSYESIWIVYKGLDIHLECLSFETQNELVRVCNNVYKYEAPYVLSRQEGKIVATMIDGSRIVVTRPPTSESYTFFLRKYDTTPSLMPKDLIRQEKAALPICMMHWLIKGECTSGVTGAMGSGKSTLMKALVRYIEETYNIRVQEVSPELNLRFTYPERNIVALVGTQDILNIIKKMNGGVTLIGEIAESIQSSFMVQSDSVASYFTMFTHHANTTEELVEAIADDLIKEGLYINKNDAIKKVAKVVDIDCHVEKIKGDRHIKHITEIVPVETSPYPSSSMDGERLPNKTMEDAIEYFHRSTNPKLHDERELIRHEYIIDENGREVGGIFKLVQLPTEQTIKDIRSHLNYQEDLRFTRDLDMMVRYDAGEKNEEMDKWIAEVLSY